MLCSIYVIENCKTRSCTYGVGWWVEQVFSLFNTLSMMLSYDYCIYQSLKSSGMSSFSLPFRRLGYDEGTLYFDFWVNLFIMFVHFGWIYHINLIISRSYYITLLFDKLFAKCSCLFAKDYLLISRHAYLNYFLMLELWLTRLFVVN